MLGKEIVKAHEFGHVCWTWDIFEALNAFYPENNYFIFI